MGKQEDGKLHALHIELLTGDRTKFKDVVRPLKKGWEAGTPATFENNTMYFEYLPETDKVSVAVSFNDGSDEVSLTRSDFLIELRKYTIGAYSC